MTGAARGAARTLIGWLLVCLAVGVAVGLLWQAVAPRVSFTVRSGALVRVIAQAPEYFQADALLGAMLAVAGLVLALIWALRGRPGGLPVAVTLMVGGALAGLLAAEVGHWIAGAEPDPAGLAEGATVTGGLRLRAWAVLVWWPVVVLLVTVAAAVLHPPAVSSDEPVEQSAPA